VPHRLFKLLLLLYPAAFREEFEAGLVEVFDYRRQQAARTRGLFWRTRFWGFITRDTVVSAWAEHRHERTLGRVERTGGGGGMEGWVQDFKYSVRRLVRSPGFTLSALAILGFGIGVNTASFSVVNAMLLQAPPFEEPEQLVELLQDSDGGAPSSTSYPAFLDISEHTEIFSSVSARAGGSATLEMEGELAQVQVDYVSSNLLLTLGLSPSRGRWFERQEDFLGGEPVAVLTHRMWRNRFASDPEVLGSTLRLNGATVTVVGVGPDSYNGGYGAATGDLWLSISTMSAVGGPARSLTRRTDHPLRVVARLAPGVTRSAAVSAMDRLAERLAAEYPDANRNRRLHVLPMTSLGAENRAEALPVAGLMMLIVGLVLLVASINLANLLLVRGVARSREMGVRLALGGSRYRLIRVLFGEVLILAVAGGALGLGMTRVLLDSLGRARLALAGPLTLDVRMDGTVLMFTVLVSLGASLVAGLLPALRATSSGVTTLLRDRSGGQSKRRFGLVGVLVSAQVAVSLVLLVSAGLFIDRLRLAGAADPGFDPERLAIVRIGLAPLALAQGETLPLFARLEEEIEGLPGVRAATLAFGVPLERRGTTTLLVGDMVDGRRRPVEVPWNIVQQDYFETLGVPLLHGRVFDQRDGPEDPERAVISEAMAQAFWGRTDVVGESYTSENAPDTPVEIIGVVANTAVQALNETPRPVVHWSTTQGLASNMVFLVRTEGEAGSVVNPMRELIRGVDPRIAILSATTMELFLGETLSRQRLTSLLLLLVGSFALGLATLGIYAVVSFGVSRRLKEVGIRIALGAAGTSVLGLFLRDATRVIGAGALVGLGSSWLVARLIGSMFMGATDVPVTVLVTCVATISVAAFLATILPARRATRLDPTRTLRQE
jgi:predicted permease